MLGDNNAKDHEAEDNNRENPQLPPEEKLITDVFAALEHFSDRQREILRMAAYVRDRQEDIDDAVTKAKEIISSRLNDVDEAALGDLWRVFNEVTEDVYSADLSDDERFRAVIKAFDEVAATLPAGTIGTYIEGLSRATLTPPAVPMMQASLLVSLVGEFEVFMGDIARSLLAKNPGLLDQSDRSFTWGEISKFSTLDEFRLSVFERTVEDLLRGSLSDWLSFFETKFKIKRPEVAKEFGVNEVVQRRHVIVHNGGVVSAQYVDKLQALGNPETVGTKLKVDYAYLSHAADLLFHTAFALTASSSFKMCKDAGLTERIEALIGNRCFFLLQEHRYKLVDEVVKALTSTLERFKNQGSKYVIKVNGWIARKKLYGLDACREEVEKWDVSALSEQYKLAKYALLGQLEQAHELASRLMRDKPEEFPPSYWMTWPLLDEVREFDQQQRDELETN